ncbi:hypothetical protein SCLCIDRAFT_610027 [Scleroderma citrinum Foug A]|uniref:Uncharacterized protein n=1 Tax=Scleroderma citrinum Foug A TaxID=1036808 RepID=A0A0C2ZSY6_9AGAM|nr:hypothetical protein SCLCIDRAFT_610027 [Scleroderma citrinum Foug A]
MHALLAPSPPPRSAIASNLRTIIATLLGSVFLVFESIMISTPPLLCCLFRVLPIHLDTTFIQPFLQDPKCFSLPFFSPTLN